MKLSHLFDQSTLEKKLSMDAPMPSLLDQTVSQTVGQSISRVEGHLKVAGQAPYTAEYQLTDLCYGVMVCVTIGKGTVQQVHDATALAIPGVIAVLHDDLFLRNPQQGGVKMAPVQGVKEIFYHGQPIALVVGETLEAAQHGAHALVIDYNHDEQQGQFDFDIQKQHAHFIDWVADKSEDVGQPEKMLAQADVKIDAIYTTPSQSNMPMEPHSSLATWTGEQLTLYTANQMLGSSKIQLAHALNLSADQIRLLSPYVGGGFGSKLGISPESVMAAIAAKTLQRPVLVNMTRPQVIKTTVRRSNTEQRVALGADRDGRLHTIIHNSIVTNLPSELFFEPVGVATHFLYHSEHRQIKYNMARMHQVLAGSMRAPGEAVGQLGLECAMDELAHALGLCPIELRKRNEPEQDPSKKIPYTTRHLIECMEQGAQAFGWEQRSPTPAQHREGDWWVGYGMACAARSNELKPSQARVSLLPAHNVLGVIARVETDMTDIGTGSYTIFSQIAADLLGLPLDHIEVKLGDSDLPVSSGSGGSWGAASAGSSIYVACDALRNRIAERVGLHQDALMLHEGNISQNQTHASSWSEPLKDQLHQHGQRLVSKVTDWIAAHTPLPSTADTQSDATPLDWTAADTHLSLQQFLHLYAPQGLVAYGEIEPGKTKQDYRHAGFGAQFAEVAVHSVTGEVRVRRMVGAFAAGRILNEKTARSQCYGGMVFGIGAALMEQIRHDKRDGRICNADLAEYQVPVHADVPDLEVIFVEDNDPYANPLHVKGIGELALAGSGAAIANAIFNATGVRIRDYPITLDKLLPHMPPL